MKTLIITVGTRQVGWKCQDGIVRSLGADGDRGHPPHIDQLYTEFNQQRGYYGNETKPEHRFSVRHLGEFIYHHCEQQEDFSSIVLPMDEIIFQSQEEDLSEVILWGTDQPESTPWNFRRGDTCWLAKLMAGKLQQIYPNLTIQIWNPLVAVNDVAAIQKHLQNFLVAYILKLLDSLDDRSLILQIQTKGSAPQIANSLEICAATLMRQCTVEQLIPVEPDPLFEVLDANSQLSQVQVATGFQSINIGQYFWPVERERIMSAWKRGDFAEAKIWLKAHCDRYQPLYNLAGHLALASNSQWRDTLKALQGIGWIDHSTTKKQASKTMRNQWRTAIQEQYKYQENPDSKFLQIWESRLLIYLHLQRLNDTAAFLQSIQLMERLLFWRYQTENWIQQEFLIPRNTEKATWGTDYPASFGELIYAWIKSEKISEEDPTFKNLQWANRKRNGIVHDNKSVTRQELSGFYGLSQDASVNEIYNTIEQQIQRFCPQHRLIPSYSLFQDLYQWGINQLQSETVS